jgi:hypothetical protein
MATNHSNRWNVLSREVFNPRGQVEYSPKNVRDVFSHRQRMFACTNRQASSAANFMEKKMATRSYIGFLDGDTVHYVYCHFDGYPEGVGQILQNHYTDIDKIKQLISRGDLSSLDITPESSIAYVDRGDDWNIRETPPYAYKSVMVSYIYLFKDSEWYVGEKKLSTVL